jgi:uncharacterized protein (DUF924 family)
VPGAFDDGDGVREEVISLALPSGTDAVLLFKKLHTRRIRGKSRFWRSAPLSGWETAWPTFLSLTPVATSSWRACRRDVRIVPDQATRTEGIVMRGIESGKQKPEPAWVEDVLRLWFAELSAGDWFRANDEIDARIRDRFLPLHESLVGKDGDGAATPRSMLATVIVLDQFSRNMFRNSPQAYAADPIACRVAKSAIEQGLDTAMTAPERMFLYLPFQHSEDAQDQLLSVNLCKPLGNEDWTYHAVAHKAIIDRFGRFPHRNAVLDRRSTAEEIEFLEQRAG